MALLSFIEKVVIDFGPIHLKLKNKKDRRALGYFLMAVGGGLFKRETYRVDYFIALE